MAANDFNLDKQEY